MAKRERDASSDVQPLTFEQALAQLEATVRALEDGQLGLDASLEQYEQGVRLLKQCRDALGAAERKIMLLTGLDADGNPLGETLGEEEGDLERKRATRSQRRSRSPAAGSSAGANPENDDDEEDEGRAGKMQPGLF